MKQRGFTVVELLITITIMGILLTLAVVNLNATQVNGRDAERTSDIVAIQANLEAFYRSGSPAYPALYTYPSTTLSSGDQTIIRNTLPDISLKSLQAPNAYNVASSFISATNATQTAVGVTPQPAVTQYVYQPLQQDGTLCTADSQKCVKYNIYYRFEADNVVYMVTSKNQ